MIANNSFIECTPISFCEGSDTERSVAPNKVQFINNIFYNLTDSLIYNTFDDISGISFSGNLINNNNQKTIEGFKKTSISVNKSSSISIPIAAKNPNNNSFDSLYKESLARLTTMLSLQPGFSDLKRLEQIESNANIECGAKWFRQLNNFNKPKQINAKCKNAECIISCLAKSNNAKLNITLTGTEYNFSTPILLITAVSFTASTKKKIQLSNGAGAAEFLIQVIAGNDFSLNHVTLTLRSFRTKSFISTDTSGSSKHSNFSFLIVRFEFERHIFYCRKYSVADSILINNCYLANSQGHYLIFFRKMIRKDIIMLKN